MYVPRSHTRTLLLFSSFYLRLPFLYINIKTAGIRVDKDSLVKQLENRGVLYQQDLDFFKAIIQEKIPFSYGGGIGISRLLMLLLRTGHIGEVQCGVWHDAHYEQATAAGCDLIPDRIVLLKNNGLSL
jgi:asparagine synthetase A